MILKLKPKRDREEQPTTLTREPSFQGMTEVFGCGYADGPGEQLFSIDGHSLRAIVDHQSLVVEGYAMFGIDAAPILDAAKRREEAEQAAAARRSAAWEAMMRGAMHGFYSAHHQDPFSFNPYMRAASPPPQSNPERSAALDKCRKLDRLAKSSTFAGERDNANRQRASIMERHGITEREL